MVQGTCKISVLAKDLGLKNKEILESHILRLCLKTSLLL